MYDELLQLMEDIETQLTSPVDRLSFFRTDIGQEFETNYIDLMAFSDLATFAIPMILNILSAILPDLESGKFIEQILKMDLPDMTEAQMNGLAKFKEFQEQL